MNKKIDLKDWAMDIGAILVVAILIAIGIMLCSI